VAQVQQPSDGIIWAATAAIAFGIVVASLLYGSEPPVLLVGLVVLAGAAIVTVRRRRRRAAWVRAAMPAPPEDRARPRPERKPVTEGSRPTAPARPPTRGTTTATGVPLGPEARRAGARGASLADKREEPGPAE
jgi:hypothetical protein